MVDDGTLLDTRCMLDKDMAKRFSRMGRIMRQPIVATGLLWHLYYGHLFDISKSPILTGICPACGVLFMRTSKIETSVK